MHALSNALLDIYDIFISESLPYTTAVLFGKEEKSLYSTHLLYGAGLCPDKQPSACARFLDNQTEKSSQVCKRAACSPS